MAIVSLGFLMSSCDLMLLDPVATATTLFPIDELEAPQMTYNTIDQTFRWEAVENASEYQIYVDNVLRMTTTELTCSIDFNDYLVSHLVGIRAIPTDFDLHAPSIVRTISFSSPLSSYDHIWVSTDPWTTNTIPADAYGNCVYLFTPEYESDYHLTLRFVSAPEGWTGLPLHWNNPETQRPEQLDANDDGTYDVHLYPDTTYLFVLYDVPSPMTAKLEVDYRFAYSENESEIFSLAPEERQVLKLDARDVGFYAYVSEDNVQVIMQAYDPAGNQLGGWYGYAFFEIREHDVLPDAPYELHLWNPADVAVEFRILKLDMSHRTLEPNREFEFQTSNHVEVLAIPTGFAGYSASIKYIYFRFSDLHQSIEFVNWQNHYTYPEGNQRSPNDGERLYELMINCGYTTYIIIQPWNNYLPEYNGTVFVTITLTDPIG
ncbi:MAG: hypothetical protein WC509_03865 [Candidatus Izemoplasmatales bacterium]